jgi:hypothetical protein
VIKPHWSVIDLDPHTWRALGRFIDPVQYFRAAQPGEHGLFVLHKDGILLRVVDSQTGVRTDLGITAVEDPVALAHHLYQTGAWQRVHVINERHLASVANLAQANPRRDLHLDEYYHLVYSLIWGDPKGYACIPPKPDNWNGWRYGDVKNFIEGLPAQCTLALGVLDKGNVEIGLIVQLQQGSIDLVTTFEALELPKSDLRIDAPTIQMVSQQISQRFAPPAMILLCTPFIFEAWLTATNKRMVIQQAETTGKAMLRKREGS